MSEKADMLMSTASPRPVFVTLHTVGTSKGKVVSQRHSKATYEYSYPVGARNDQLMSTWLWTICMCFHSSRVHVYIHVLCIHSQNNTH